jgi:D-alanine-D-alanine ligase
MQKLIAVMAGGNSHEEVISLRSCETILKYIDRAKYQPVKVIVKGMNWVAEWNGVTYPVDRNDFSFSSPQGKHKFQGAYIIIHGPPGEDGTLPAWLDLMGIPHSTNHAFEGALTFNKYVCNQLAKIYGATIAASVIISSVNELNAHEIESSIGFPCFVKPNDSGSSFGVTKVKEVQQLKAAVVHAFEHGKQVVIEKAVAGVEVSCGVVGLQGKTHVLPVTEIVPSTEFFDFAAKYEGKSEEITPARISVAETQLVQQTTSMLYEKLNLRGLARIDFIIEKGIPYLIEINTIPGMSEQSIIPQQVKVHGWELKWLLTTLVDEMMQG